MRNGPLCVTLYYMKTTLSIRLDEETDRLLNQISKQAGRTRSEVVRDALRRQLAVLQFDQLRKEVLPFAEASGYLTDEDVFRDIS